MHVSERLSDPFEAKFTPTKSPLKIILPLPLKILHHAIKFKPLKNGEGWNDSKNDHMSLIGSYISPPKTPYLIRLRKSCGGSFLGVVLWSWRGSDPSSIQQTSKNTRYNKTDFLLDL